MKYIKRFDTLSAQTEYLNSADIDTYVGYVDENETVYYDDAIPEPVPFEEQYLTIESLEDNNTIYWYSSTNSDYKTISASTDNGATWAEYTSTTGGSGTTIATLNSGDTIIFKGTNVQYNTRGIFHSTSTFNAYGNIMSLVYGDNFSGQTTLTSGNTFNRLFANSNIVSAENLILPATTLSNSCYVNMFYGCSSLTVAPALPTMTLAYDCYDSMFRNCTSLTTAPELPATTLANSCYNSMFHSCSNLIVAPELPATTLADSCYGGMFYGCTSLNHIKCLATDISAFNCTGNWVGNVASTGTFVKAASMNDWTTGNNGIPNNWTIENE